MATVRLNREPTTDALTVGGAPNWAVTIPAARRKHLLIWLFTGAAITTLILIIGGITRLTESGLSIVDWEPIIGAVPPLNDADWDEAFARYQQFPEYVMLRPDMTLSEFKFIYFWEYLHRMMGRLLGVVFLVPFIWFWIRGYLNAPLLRRSLLLFALGGLQGAMGWFMVQSGLVDRPDVSHYRLAAHLSLAVIIFGCCLWFANDLLTRPAQTMTMRTRSLLQRSLVGIGVLLGIQIVWGAFVAGLKAGLSYNTFPLMAGGWLPPAAWRLEPVLLNLVENAATVQWAHRVLATILLVAVVALWFRVQRDNSLMRLRRWSTVLAGLIIFQYVLGVATLLTHVRIGIAVSHQLVALLTVGVLLTFLHVVVYSVPEEHESASAR